MAGRIEALSVNTNFPLGARLTTALLLRLLGRPTHSIALGDVEDFDHALAKGMKCLLDSDVDSMGANLKFECTITQGDGSVIDVPLMANGGNVTVTNANKRKYVNALIQKRLWFGIESQANAFVRGFSSVLPKKNASILTADELGHLLRV